MNFTAKYFWFFLVVFLFYPLGVRAAEPSPPPAATATKVEDKAAVPTPPATAAPKAEGQTTVPSVRLGPLVTVRMLDWGNYIVELEPELQKFLKKTGSNVKIEYVKPPISTAADLLKRSAEPGVDVVTPSVSFFGQEPSLKKSFARLKLTDISPAMAQLVPDMVRTEGSICVPIYGGWMSVFTKDLSEPVADFTIFENPVLKGLYALPQQEPWHIAYLVYQLLKTPSKERFTKASLESAPFRDKYKKLIVNAGLVYNHYNMSLVDLGKMKLLYGFGFRLPNVWKSATQIKNLPYYLDCLAMTKAGAQDAEKRKFFNLMQYWMLNKFGQNLVTQKIEGTFNMTTTSLDINGMYTGLDSKRMKILTTLHDDAVARRSSGR